MKKYVLLLGVLFLCGYNTSLFGQSANNIELILPSASNWNLIEEGQKIEFDIKANGGSDSIFSYFIIQGFIDGMNFDSTGKFYWTPNFNTVDRLAQSKNISLVVEARNKHKESASKSIELIVNQVNRPPKIGDLKPFYVQYDLINTYRPDPSIVTDDDHDPIVFIPITDQMPEGAKLSEQGELSWKPSLTQFKKLRIQPLIIEFFLEDQPSKARTKGKLRIEATQLDLPPLITIIPETKHIRFEEDATVNLKFYLSDPNGDEDIATFDFISENTGVSRQSLVKNTNTQYEFIWDPGYSFVKDPFDSLDFNITFFVIDKTYHRSEKKIKVTILNAINEAEKDHSLYQQYRMALVRAWDLHEQLKEKEKDLKRDYHRAKKGKKGRAIANASLGAVTGVVPIINSIPTNTQRAVSAVGGTTVMTIGTLEATEVIGKSTRDLIERLNYVIEKKNEIQTKGDNFARKYSLKSLRRHPEFINDMEGFLSVMNLKGLVALELNAGWRNKNKASDNNISRTFKDFMPED